MIYHCECGWKVVSPIDFDLTCPRCQASLAIRDGIMHSRDGDPTIPKIIPVEDVPIIPPDQWPTWTILVKCCRYREDIGVGDTVKRMADTIGGERFQRWAQQCGIPCGCVERHERWNKLYPYED